MTKLIRYPGFLLVPLLLGTPVTLPGQQQQNAKSGTASTPPRMTSQEQLQALREGTLNLYNKQLSKEELSLRDDVVAMRDSLAPVKEYASRLDHALRVGMPSVALSALKELAPACARALQTTTALRAGVNALRLRSNDLGKQQRYNKILANYRSHFEAVSSKMTNCRQQSTILAAGKPLDQVKAAALATALLDSVLSYEATSRGLLTEFGIPLKPRQLEREAGNQ